MGIGALLGDMGIMTSRAVNDCISSVYLVISYTAHACCCSVRIVTGFTNTFLFFPPGNVNVQNATFIGKVVAVTTGYPIFNIMWGFLGQSGCTGKDKKETQHY
jgi:hypothetical protein